MVSLKTQIWNSLWSEESPGENRTHLNCFCCEFIESFDLQESSIALLCLFALCIAQ